MIDQICLSDHVPCVIEENKGERILLLYSISTVNDDIFKLASDSLLTGIISPSILIYLNQVFYQSTRQRISGFSFLKNRYLKHVWPNHLTSFFSHGVKGTVECTCQIILAWTELITSLAKSFFRDILLTLRNYWWQVSEWEEQTDLLS